MTPGYIYLAAALCCKKLQLNVLDAAAMLWKALTRDIVLDVVL
jgi:hypothetical protein